MKKIILFILVLGILIFLVQANQTDTNSTQTDLNITLNETDLNMTDDILINDTDKNKTKEKKIKLDGHSIKKYKNSTDDVLITLENITNALIYYENGTIIGSKIIKNNDGELNISIKSNETIYVLDNFQLREENPIEDSPIWFSYSSDTQKNISSTIKDIVTINVEFDITQNCSNIDSIKYVSNSGNLTYSPPYDCFNGTINLELEGVEPAQSSNTILIELIKILPSGVTTGGSPPAGTQSEPIYDVQAAESESIELTIKLKNLIDQIPIKIKQGYEFIKSKFLHIGSLISPQNKERGAIILLVVIVVIIFTVFRYNEYLEVKYGKAKDKLFGKAYRKISKKERTKRIKYIDGLN